MVDWFLIVFVLVFVGLDCLSGLLKGVANNDLSSKKMRIGLLHKATYFLSIGLAIALEFAAGYIDFGVEVAGVVYIATCGWVILAEVTSILENVCSINPSLRETKLFKLFSHEEQS